MALAGEIILESLDHSTDIYGTDVKMGHEPDFLSSADQDTALFQMSLQGFEPGRLHGEEDHVGLNP
jgi:hypothetical protein